MHRDNPKDYSVAVLYMMMFATMLVLTVITACWYTLWIAILSAVLCACFVFGIVWEVLRND